MHLTVTAGANSTRSSTPIDLGIPKIHAQRTRQRLVLAVNRGSTLEGTRTSTKNRILRRNECSCRRRRSLLGISVFPDCSRSFTAEAMCGCFPSYNRTPEKVQDRSPPPQLSIKQSYLIPLLSFFLVVYCGSWDFVEPSNHKFTTTLSIPCSSVLPISAAEPLDFLRAAGRVVTGRAR
jgi:hypothetical protein